MEDTIEIIYNKLDDLTKQKTLTQSDVEYIRDNVTQVQMIHCDIVDGILQEQKALNSRHEKEINDLTEKHKSERDDWIREKEIMITKTRQIATRNNLIWKGKILVRQLENDRFYTMAKKYEEQLNKIKLDELVITLKRKDTINNHIGVKFAIAIINDKIVVPGFTKNICQKYINDNDEMHPKYKPLSDVIGELLTFKTIVDSLNEDERIKFGVYPEIISEEIELFKKTDN